MIDDKVKKRIERKFAEKIESSECFFLFDDFKFKHAILQDLELKNIELTAKDIFLILYISSTHYTIIANCSFVIVFGVKINVIEFAKIKGIKINAAPLLLQGSKEFIDELLITKITGDIFSIKFLNQDDLFLFDRIVSNIPIHDLLS